MAALGLYGQDERRRKRHRSLLMGALVTLLVLWTCKLAFPQQAAATIRSSSHAIEHTLGQGVLALYNKTLPVEDPIVSEPPPIPSGDYLSLYNGTIMDKVAVIIEDRPKPNLVPLVLHFSTVLGPTWPIIIYTSAETTAHFSTSKALLRLIHTGVIQLRQLPSTILFDKSDAVSSFLTQPWLWEELEPAKYVLLFQTDSVLCSKAARSVEDFFDYDFVGAPIATNLWAAGGYNGGLSLRKRESFLRITKEFDWIDNTNQELRYEDRWFHDKLMIVRDREAADPKSRPSNATEIILPGMEVARTFAVETITYPHPLGYHQPGRYINSEKDMKILNEWCPEYKLCDSGDYIPV